MTVSVDLKHTVLHLDDISIIRKKQKQNVHWRDKVVTSAAQTSASRIFNKNLFLDGIREHFFLG